MMRTLPDEIKSISLPSGAVTVDGHGYLTNTEDWTLEFAEFVAREENLQLGPQHFEVIDFMRTYFDEHGVAADARFVLKFLAAGSGLTKIGAKQVLFALFPYGYVKQACKLAGMKQPRAWSTG